MTVRLTPPDGAIPGKGELTLEAGGASTTTTVPITDVGLSMRFGAWVPPDTGPVLVYVDDVRCQVSD